MSGGTYAAEQTPEPEIAQAGALPVGRLGPPSALMAALSGAAMGLSFYPQGLYPMAWVGLVPLFATLPGTSLRQSLRLSLIFGIVYSGILNFYIAVTVFRARVWFPYAQWQAILVTAGAYGGAVLICSVWYALFGVLHRGVRRLGGRECSAFGVAALWTGIEFLRSLGPFGYTWGDVGYTQVPWTGGLRVAATVGSFGLSFLIVWFNAALSEALTQSVRPVWRALQSVCITGVLLWLMARGTEFSVRRGTAQRIGEVRLVQPGFSNFVKLDAHSYRRNLADQVALSYSRTDAPSLVVWPETAILEPLKGRTETFDQVSELAHNLRSHLIVGALDEDDRGKQYNAAFAVSPAGRMSGVYHKRRLVPFGEYVPMSKRWKFMRFFSFREREFSSGEESRLLPGPFGPVGVAICFESTFPGYARELTRQGAKALVVLTNDEWMIGTAAPALHLAMSQMRAAENRRMVLRATNSGISAIIDERGRVVRSLPQGKSGTVEGEAVGRSDRSVYTIVGEWWLLACVLALLWALLKAAKDPAHTAR